MSSMAAALAAPPITASRGCVASKASAAPAVAPSRTREILRISTPFISGAAQTGTEGGFLEGRGPHRPSARGGASDSALARGSFGLNRLSSARAIPFRELAMIASPGVPDQAGPPPWFTRSAMASLRNLSQLGPARFGGYRFPAPHGRTGSKKCPAEAGQRLGG